MAKSRILTTTIGAFPKPDYVPVLDWFEAENGMSTATATLAYEQNLANAGEAAEDLFVKAAQEVITDQVNAGVDIPTDGEVRRERIKKMKIKEKVEE